MQSDYYDSPLLPCLSFQHPLINDWVSTRFVLEIGLSYSEKKLFWWWQKYLQIRGWRPIIFNFEITRIQTVKGQNNFWNRKIGFSDFSSSFLFPCAIDLSFSHTFSLLNLFLMVEECKDFFCYQVFFFCSQNNFGCIFFFFLPTMHSFCILYLFCSTGCIIVIVSIAFFKATVSNRVYTRKLAIIR